MNMARTTDKIAWKTGELLDWTTQFFTRCEIEDPRLSAELLLAHALGVSRMALYTQYDQFPPPEKVAAFRELVRRRKDHTPVAYLVGKAWFFSLEFSVSPDVLIPRPDTETLVEQVISLVRSRPDWAAPEILDLGTGSGCIALALAKNLPAARLTATDISAAALAVAKSNAESIQPASSIRWLQGDLFAAIEALSPPVRFKVIVSNPPYIPGSQVDGLMPEVSRHEPRLALDGGSDGLRFFERIAKSAPDWLEPGGVLAMETAFNQAAAVEKNLLAAGCFGNARIARDAAGRQRCVIAQLLTEPAGNHP